MSEREENREVRRQMEQIKGGVKGIPLCPADRLGQADVIMGSLKCDLSHITVRTVNNHTHTLQGNSNAGRQQSGNRYTYLLVCICARLDTHIQACTHSHIHTFTSTQMHKETSMHTHIIVHTYKYNCTCTCTLPKICSSHMDTRTHTHTTAGQAF